MAGQRGGDFGRLAAGLRLPRDPLGEITAFQEFHREIRAALRVSNVVDLHDVGMPKCSHRLRFPKESG
jgi:hypothetical protein